MQYADVQLQPLNFVPEPGTVPLLAAAALFAARSVAHGRRARR